MPKVTLLGADGRSYDLIIGVKKYVFHTGKAKSVPAVVAIEAGKKLDEKGRPLFAVEDMPKIIKRRVEVSPQCIKTEKSLGTDAHDQNATAVPFIRRQQVFKPWPLEFM